MKKIILVSLICAAAWGASAQSIENPPPVVGTGNNTFTGVQNIMSATNDPLVVSGGSGEAIAVESSGFYPTITFFRQDATLPANTAIAELQYVGNNSLSIAKNFASISTYVLVDTAGSEQGKIDFALANGTGSSTSYMAIVPGALSLVNSTSLEIAGHVLISPTAPTIGSGFGTAPSVLTSNGATAFNVKVGTGGIATSGVMTMPAASGGWNCGVTDSTTTSTTVFTTKETASTTTSVTIGNFTSTAVAGAWVAGDVLRFVCAAY